MQKILPVVFLFIGIGVGWFVSSRSSSPSADAETPKKEGIPSAVAAAQEKETKPGSEADTPGLEADIGQLLVAAFKPGGVNYAALKPLMGALAQMSSANLFEYTRFFDKESMREPQVFLWRLFFSAWGAFDPDGAIAYIDKRFDQANARQLFYAAVMDTWKDGAIGKMLEFAADKYLAGKEGDGASLALEYLRSMSESNPAATAEMAKMLGDGEFVLELVSRRIAQLVKEDREKALAAIEGLQGEAHTHAAGQYMKEWAKEDAVAAAQWMLDNYTPDLTPSVIAGVAAEYAQRDPNAAMSWIAKLPEGVPKADVVAKAFGLWAQTDANAALGWLGGASSQPIYDSAVVTAGSILMSTAPREVIEQWVPKITDPATANSLLYETSLIWQRDNLRDYSEWLETTQAISPTTKERLLKRELPGDGETPGQPATTTAPPAPEEQGRFDGDGG